MKNNDFIIVLAWPEGMVDGAGGWYDKIFSRNGKYRVGHSAIALINSSNHRICYFDFGRYQTPIGYGRIRDDETDPDTRIKNKPKINDSRIENIKEILIEISNNKSYHGKGPLYSSILPNIDFESGFRHAKKWQEKGAIPYGPFNRNGTNCSRFVAKITRKSHPPFIKKIRLKFPFCISPSPKRNVSIGNRNYYMTFNNKCSYIKRNHLAGYFCGIEINK